MQEHLYIGANLPFTIQVQIYLSQYRCKSTFYNTGANLPFTIQVQIYLRADLLSITDWRHSSAASYEPQPQLRRTMHTVHYETNSRHYMNN